MPRYTYCIFCFIILFSSCVPYENLLNFRKTEEFQTIPAHELTNLHRIKIVPDDILYIQVSSTDGISADPFNLIKIAQSQGGNAGGNPFLGYLVSPEGYIEMPVLGTMKVEGLTTEQLRTKVLEQLNEYLNAPVVNIRFLNFKITVLGEVRTPGQIQIPGERFTLLEAIGLSGDFTPYSNRDVVLVIREDNDQRSFGYVDLRSPDIFQSPYFYLQQNDIIYVEPIKAVTATVRDPISEALPILSGILSIAALAFAITR